MSQDDVLDQDEIDALFGEEDKQETDDKPDQVDKTIPQTYDLGTQNKIIRGRMPTLQVINERFARAFRITLFNFLRKTPDISVLGIDVAKYSEYIQKLYVPTSLNVVKMNPLRGLALFVVDAKMVFSLVENFFGGGGQFHNKIEGREFTPTENRVVQMMLSHVFNDLHNAWSSVIDIDFKHVNTEINPSMANMIAPTEIVLISRFRVELEGGGGELHMTMPYSMIEPIKELLDTGVQSEKDNDDIRWVNSIRQEVLEATVDIGCVLAQKKMYLEDVEALKSGDLLVVDMLDEVPLLANGVPIFNTKFGVHDGKYSLQIENRFKTTDE